MRPSVLSRSVVAVASLAIGSVALAATPASAATSDITRDQVIAAVNAVRADAADEEGSGGPIEAVYPLVSAACNVLPGETIVYASGEATEEGEAADGLLATGAIETADGASDLSGVRFCVFGATASTDATFALSGSTTLSYTSADAPGNDPVPHTTSRALSGTVGVSKPYLFDLTLGFPTDVTLVSNGNAVRTTSVTTTKTITVAKTASQKKSAKKTYAKRLKTAKKAYVKALDKAGSKTTKKKAAKKKYSAAKSSAKTAYRKAIGSVRTNVPVSEPRTETRPFSVSAEQPSQVDD